MLAFWKFQQNQLRGTCRKIKKSVFSVTEGQVTAGQYMNFLRLQKNKLGGCNSLVDLESYSTDVILSYNIKTEFKDSIT